MLMPGSGWAALILVRMDCRSRRHAGEMEGAHMPAPLQMLDGIKARSRCGCGRDWGCFEVYTTISGLPHLLRRSSKISDHELATAPGTPKEKRLTRSRAQKGDPLALEIFDFKPGHGTAHRQPHTGARWNRHHHGGGLMDHESTTPEFRERYLRQIREAADPVFSGPPNGRRSRLFPPFLGELSCHRRRARGALSIGSSQRDRSP